MLAEWTGRGVLYDLAAGTHHAPEGLRGADTKTAR